MSMGKLPFRFLFGPASKQFLNSRKSLGKLFAANSPASSICVRQLGLAARLGAKPIVGWKHGHQDDPEMWTLDEDAPGQEHIPEWLYRSPREYPKHYGWWERGYTHFISAFFFFWVFYHLYWDYGHLIGEWYIPDLDEFTDEELGIPPDDAADPEFWGYHQTHAPVE